MLDFKLLIKRGNVEVLQHSSYAIHTLVCIFEFFFLYSHDNSKFFSNNSNGFDSAKWYLSPFQESPTKPNKEFNNQSERIPIESVYKGILYFFDLIWKEIWKSKGNTLKISFVSNSGHTRLFLGENLKKNQQVCL